MPKKINIEEKLGLLGSIAAESKRFKSHNQDLIIASQEMIRTVLTPTIFVNPEPNRRPPEPGAGGNYDYVW